MNSPDSSNLTCAPMPKTRVCLRTELYTAEYLSRDSQTFRFLLEGLDRDDAWIMVEDEFYAIAQSFTQHLHYAEYVRRKKEAKARTTEPERPTDGRTSMPKSVQRKKEAEALDARQKDGLAQIDGNGRNQDPSEDEDDDTWAGTHLHGLMTSPRKSRSLVGVQGVKSSTRAAAGFGQVASSQTTACEPPNVPSSPPPIPLLSRAAQSHVVELDISTGSEDDDDDDDLDKEVPQPVRPPNKRPVSPPSRTVVDQNQTPKSRPRPQQTEAVRAEASSRRATQRSKTPKLESGFKSKMDMFFDDFDKLPEPSESDSTISNGPNDTKPGTSTPRKTDGDHNLQSKSRYKDVPTFIV